MLEEAFNASLSMKVMAVNLRVHCESTMRCDKPSVTNLVSRTKVLLRSYSGEALYQCSHVGLFELLRNEESRASTVESDATLCLVQAEASGCRR